MGAPQQKPPPPTVPSKVVVKKLKSAQLDIEVYAQVLPDGTSKDPAVDGETSFNPQGALSDGKGGKLFYQTPGYSWQKKGGQEIVTKLSGPVEIKGTVEIKTVYGPGKSPTSRSQYGRGTTPEDEKAGNTSLGFHESCHRSDYLSYLKTKPLPIFTGKPGISRPLYDQAAHAFGKAIGKYFTDMEQDSFERTDEVGYTKSVYKKKGAHP